MIIVLCGIPGSGKSTMCKTKYSQYIRISQDQLGTREACIKKANEELLKKNSVVIDRANVSKQQRKFWIDLAKKRGVECHCVVLKTPKDVCIERVLARKDHETLGPSVSNEKKIKVVEDFNRSFETPDLDEGFNVIEITFG